MVTTADDSLTTIATDHVRVTVELRDGMAVETYHIRHEGVWLAALTAEGLPTRARWAGSNKYRSTADWRALGVTEQGEGDQATITVAWRANAAELQREISLRDGAVLVRVRLTPTFESFILYQLEDRLEFVPALRAGDTPQEGPLDFVWSQQVKKRPDNMVPHWAFKSPVVMFQQGPVFAALMPDLSGVSAASLADRPLGMDLQVNGCPRPWLGAGIIPSKPDHIAVGGLEGHSLFSRSGEAIESRKGRPVEYTYRILLSAQPPRLGYRSAVRYLWENLGRSELLNSPDLQQNVEAKQLYLFDDWRADTWGRYADEIYREFDYDGVQCGLLTSVRFSDASRTASEEDGWFQFWCQSLRSAYGWFMHGQRIGSAGIMERAERVLNLALKAPQSMGAFPIIYYHETDGAHTWLRDDPWAGYVDEYHTIHMAWQAYWLLRWAQDLVPQRADEIVAYCRAFGDFLLRHQLPSGCIPSWYDEAGRPSRAEFREFNAEVAGCALFLTELAGITGEQAYLRAAERAMAFVEAAVLPRQRWHDFETFLSCSPKPFHFYDHITTQYPQNNVSTIMASMAYLQLYRLTGAERYLDLGRAVTDYLCLTQQVWNHPLLEPKMVGGFTTQNTDGEWSDARQGYCADLLLDYYNATGELEYLERAVAAARSGFAVAPYENWAHMGYGGLHWMSGMHWGTGTVMTSVERMSAQLGDAYINVERAHGVGFNACSVTGVHVFGNQVSITIQAAHAWQEALHLRLSGLVAAQTYHITVNHGYEMRSRGLDLQQAGLWVPAAHCKRAGAPAAA